MCKGVSVKIILDLLDAAGYEPERSSASSHRCYSRPQGGATIVVAWGNRNDTIPIGTARCIVRAAGPQVEQAFSDIIRGGGGAALKSHIKALKRAFE